VEDIRRLGVPALGRLRHVRLGGGPQSG
jgi:hypothetical protein